MRTEILDYLQSQNLGTITVSREYPWSENGVPMYLKNLKKVYAEAEQVENTPLITALDGTYVPSEVTTVTVFIACDAKQTPPNLDQIIASIRTAKDITTIEGVFRRECSVSTSYENDVLVTQLDFRFTKIT